MTKRIISVLLALVLVLALAMPAMAATLNVDDTNKYVAYQIFTGDYIAGATDGNVFANAKFGSAADETKLKAWLAPDAETFTATDAVEAIGAIKDMTPVEIATRLADCVKEGTEIDLPDDVVSGYYLIVDVTENADTKSAYILNVYNQDLTIAKKRSDVPDTDKKIDEDEEDVNVSAYDYGDEVKFYLTATVPTGFDNYDVYTMIFKDTMDDGLTYNGNAKITEPAALKDIAATTKGNGFELKVEDLTEVTGITAGTVIKVEYTAILNENATIGQTGNVNEFTLDFTNGPEEDDFGTTNPVSAVVFTFELDGDKFDGDSKAALAGAKFKLMRGSEYAVIDEDTLKLTGWTSDETAASILESDDQGNFGVKGLKDGVYTLIEVEAPKGYNKLTTNVTFEIKYETTQNPENKVVLDTSSAETTVNADGVIEKDVENNAGTTLPSTGGIGTTIFYLVGGLMMAAAVVLLVAKKRTVNE
ncbi:MAG: isopeptide-forming domain-containing fimbrial protein [Clostridia bacterium]|nr:isopeptide-forming domain-containing fimbrial protein [Clostridia bacterium]